MKNYFNFCIIAVITLLLMETFTWPNVSVWPDVSVSRFHSQWHPVHYLHPTPGNQKFLHTMGHR